ncbi:MAG TPA: DNA-binding protein [Stellaceae bacterium]
MTDLPSRRHNRKGAAVFLAGQGFEISAATLATMATRGGGPVFQRFGRKPVYTEDDLLAWATGRLSPPMTSTSAPAPTEPLPAQHRRKIACAP